jgi:hypothetical protein
MQIVIRGQKKDHTPDRLGITEFLTTGKTTKAND